MPQIAPKKIILAPNMSYKVVEMSQMCIGGSNTHALYIKHAGKVRCGTLTERLLLRTGKRGLGLIGPGKSKEACCC